jgi:nucleotide-binding universal stress UspA family protein
MAKISGYPLDIFTDTERRTNDYFDKQLEAAGLLEDVKQQVRKWHKITNGRFEQSLYHVPHDALLVVGAYGHGLIKDFLFGSKMEKIQSLMPNNILLVGPNTIFRGV